MKKMKLVNVYSGYGENSIVGVERFEGLSIEDGVSEVKGRCVNEDSEFFGNWVKYSDDLCGVDFGEENFYWVIGEGNEWYERVDIDGVYGEDWGKWEELCYMYCDE